MHRRHTTIETLGLAGMILAGGLTSGCKHEITVQPIRVEPIHLTVDVNVHVDKQLADSFDFEDRIEKQAQSSPATTMPAPAATGPNSPATAGGVQ